MARWQMVCFQHSQDFSNLISSNEYFRHVFNDPLEELARDMSGMFQNCHVFHQPLARWDVSEVTTMARMFASTKSFRQSLASWDTSQVRDMSFTFLHARAFGSGSRTHSLFEVLHHNLRSLQSALGMFRDARSIHVDALQEQWKSVLSTRPGVDTYRMISETNRSQCCVLRDVSASKYH